MKSTRPFEAQRCCEEAHCWFLMNNSYVLGVYSTKDAAKRAAWRRYEAWQSTVKQKGAIRERLR